MPLTLTLTSFHQACVFIECKMENRSARDSKKESGISLVWLNSLNSCTMWQWLFTRILTKRFDLYLNFPPPPVKIRQIRFPFVMVKILPRICMARQTFDRILSRKTYSTMPNVLHSLPRIPKQNFEPAPSPLLAYHTSSIIRAMAQWTHPSEVYFKPRNFDSSLKFVTRRVCKISVATIYITTVDSNINTLRISKTIKSDQTMIKKPIKKGILEKEGRANRINLDSKIATFISLPIKEKWREEKRGKKTSSLGHRKASEVEAKVANASRKLDRGVSVSPESVAGTI